MKVDIELTSRTNIQRFQDRSSHFIASIEIELMRARRYERPLSIIAIFDPNDKDGRGGDGPMFRRLNFEKRLRQAAPQLLRLTDFWGRVERFGFIIVLPETAQSGAAGTVERLVAMEEFDKLIEDGKKRPDVAFGVAEVSVDMARFHDLVSAARRNEVWRAD